MWPLLETLFSEVLTRDEWLRLFDNVFSNHPAFLLVAVVAYVTCCRAQLLTLTFREDFEVAERQMVVQVLCTFTAMNTQKQVPLFKLIVLLINMLLLHSTQKEKYSSDLLHIFFGFLVQFLCLINFKDPVK